MARIHRVEGATPKKPRRKKQPAPAKPTGKPRTDPVAFDKLLKAARWTWADVVKRQTFTTDIDTYFEHVDARMECGGAAFKVSSLRTKAKRARRDHHEE